MLFASLKKTYSLLSSNVVVLGLGEPRIGSVSKFRHIGTDPRIGSVSKFRHIGTECLKKYRPSDLQ
jgi:hypothetical protein